MLIRGLANLPQMCNYGSAMENTVEKLDSINRTLEKMGIALENISAAMAKPKENKFVRIMEFAVLVVSVFGVIQLIDIVMKWIAGG